MKKYLLFGLIIIVSFFFLPREEYLELNQLAIIKKVEVVCLNQKISVSLIEWIPKRNNNGIKYDKKKYSFEGNTFSDIKKEIEKESKKMDYYYVKDFNTNCSNKKKLIEYFQIKE